MDEQRPDPTWAMAHSSTTVRVGRLPPRQIVRPIGFFRAMPLALGKWGAMPSRFGPRRRQPFLEGYPKVCIKVYQTHGAYRVQTCLLWFDKNGARYLGSGENYESTEAAIVEMKRQTMNLLRERGRTQTERDVHWEIETELEGHA